MLDAIDTCYPMTEVTAADTANIQFNQDTKPKPSPSADLLFLVRGKSL
jgi:hypothetical protein